MGPLNGCQPRSLGGLMEKSRGPTQVVALVAVEFITTNIRSTASTTGSVSTSGTAITNIRASQWMRRAPNLMIVSWRVITLAMALNKKERSAIETRAKPCAERDKVFLF